MNAFMAAGAVGGIIAGVVLVGCLLLVAAIQEWLLNKKRNNKLRKSGWRPF
jgi:hypothetical protein